MKNKYSVKIEGGLLGFNSSVYAISGNLIRGEEIIPEILGRISLLSHQV